jgi:hypothetical protein
VSTNDILTSEGRQEIARILNGTRIPAEYVEYVPAAWRTAAAPAEPGAGVYLVGNGLVARVGYDDMRDRWRYLGDLDRGPRTRIDLDEDLTWVQVWAEFGGTGVQVLPLFVSDGVNAAEFPKLATARNGYSVEVTPTASAVHVSVRGTGYSVDFTSEEALSLATGLFAAVRARQPR